MPGSVTRTVRLDEQLDKALQRRANDESVSTNFFVNKAIRRYIEWDLPGERIGMVDAPLVVVGKLLDEIEEQRCAELGRRAAKDFVKPFVLHLFGEFSVNTSILFFKRASRYANRFTFDDTEDGGKHVLVLRHAVGRKWSRYYGGLMEGVFGDLLGRRVKVECTDDLCVVQFEAP